MISRHPPTYTLTIDDLMAADGGMYTCVLKDSSGATVRSSCKVTVKPQQEQPQEPLIKAQKEEPLVKAPIEIPVQEETPPPQKQQQEQPPQQPTSKPRKQTPPKQQKQPPPVKEKVDTKKMEEKDDKKQKVEKVDVVKKAASPPPTSSSPPSSDVFVEPLTDVTAMEGEALKLHTKVRVVEGQIVTWKKNGNTIKSTPFTKITSTRDGTLTLVIR